MAILVSEAISPVGWASIAAIVLAAMLWFLSQRKRGPQLQSEESFPEERRPFNIESLTPDYARTHLDELGHRAETQLVALLRDARIARRMRYFNLSRLEVIEQGFEDKPFSVTAAELKGIPTAAVGDDMLLLYKECLLEDGSLPTLKCAPFDQLDEWLEAGVVPNTHAAHVKECEPCLARLEFLESLRSQMRLALKIL